MGISTALRRITLRRWSWIFFKVAALSYGVTLWVFTPKVIAETLPASITNIAFALIVGALVSIAGIVMVSQTGRVAVWGLTVELMGIMMVAAGVAAYLLTQIYLVVTLPTGTDRIAFCVLLVWVLAALFARAVIVMPRRHKEGHDPRKGM